MFRKTSELNSNCGELMQSFRQIQSPHYVWCKAGRYLYVLAQSPLLLHSICFPPSSLFMCYLPSALHPSVFPSSPLSTPLISPRLEWMGSSPALSFSGYLETSAIDTPPGNLSRDGWVFCCNYLCLSANGRNKKKKVFLHFEYLYMFMQLCIIIKCLCLHISIEMWRTVLWVQCWP